MTQIELIYTDKNPWSPVSSVSSAFPSSIFNSAYSLRDFRRSPTVFKLIFYSIH